MHFPSSLSLYINVITIFTGTVAQKEVKLSVLSTFPRIATRGGKNTLEQHIRKHSWIIVTTHTSTNLPSFFERMPAIGKRRKKGKRRKQESQRCSRSTCPDAGVSAERGSGGGALRPWSLNLCTSYGPAVKAARRTLMPKSESPATSKPACSAKTIWMPQYTASDSGRGHIESLGSRWRCWFRWQKEKSSEEGFS